MTCLMPEVFGISNMQSLQALLGKSQHLQILQEKSFPKQTLSG